jgi:hypothetical protein
MRPQTGVELDDGAHRCIGCFVEIGKSNKMGAAIHVIDHGCAPELVVQPARDKSFDNRLRCACVIEDEIREAPIDPLLGKSAVHDLMISPLSPGPCITGSGGAPSHKPKAIAGWADRCLPGRPACHGETWQRHRDRMARLSSLRSPHFAPHP